MTESVLHKIKKVFPHQIHSEKILNDGWANSVIEVNNEWIFRFSKSEFTKPQMKIETLFLPEFSKKSFLPVPLLEYFDEDFMVYKKIPGEPLRGSVLELLSEPQKEEVAQQLGLFLTSLHSFSYSAPVLEFPYGGADFWNDIWPVASPHFLPEQQKAAKEYFQEALKKINPGSLVISHGDLGTSNIFFNSKLNKISGIIDFGDICKHDPARDFNGFYRHHGRSFTEKILKYYQREPGPNFWERVDFFARKQPLMILFYAPRFGQQALIPKLAEAIQKMTF